MNIEIYGARVCGFSSRYSANKDVRLLINILFMFLAPEVQGLYILPDDCKSHGISNNLISGVMAVVMGFVTVLKVTRAVPKRIMDAAKDYTTPACNVETISKQHQLPTPAPTIPTVSMAEFSAVTKRLGELEDRLRVVSSKTAEISFEKEQLLNAATSRVDKLETELEATKKVRLFVSIA